MRQKPSIQKKIEDAKTQIEQAKSKGELSPAALSIINILMTIVELMLLIILEKKTRRNSSNSGIPPSQDFGRKENRNKKGDKDNKKKRGSQLDNTRHIVEEKISSPLNCQNCNADLQTVEAMDSEKRTMIDIMYEVKETVVATEKKACPDCGVINTGIFPNGMDGKEQYGVGIRADIINMMIVQMISLIRIQEYYKGLLGRFISQAVMLKYNNQLGISLIAWENAMIVEILKSPVIYVDETSIRVEGKLYWIHTYSAGHIVLQFVHPSRGREAIDEIDIIPRYKGIIVHDRYSSYFTYTHLLHALCIAHLLRDLNFVEESTNNKWASKLKMLLKVAIKMVNKEESKVLPDEKYNQLQRVYRMILSNALLELPSFDESGERGRPKQTDAQNLWEAFVTYEKAILLFACVAEVDATNNRAERDLRMNKVKQKVAGCFRKFENAKYFCRNRSFIMTMRNLGFSSMEAIHLGLRGEFLLRKEKLGSFAGLKGNTVLSPATIDRDLKKKQMPKVNIPIIPVGHVLNYNIPPPGV